MGKTRDRYNSTVRETSQNINSYLYSRQERYEFQRLTNLHFESISIANEAYSVYEDAKTSIKSIYKLIKAVKQKEVSLRKELEQAKVDRDTKRKNEIYEEFKILSKTKNDLYKEADRIKKDKELFLENVRSLNNKTRELKELIRDNCGTRGFYWYLEREAKI